MLPLCRRFVEEKFFFFRCVRGGEEEEWVDGCARSVLFAIFCRIEGKKKAVGSQSPLFSAACVSFKADKRARRVHTPPHEKQKNAKRGMVENEKTGNPQKKGGEIQQQRRRTVSETLVHKDSKTPAWFKPYMMVDGKQPEWTAAHSVSTAGSLGHAYLDVHCGGDVDGP